VIAYFDTSAIVPLLIAEPTSQACRRIWDAADDVVTHRIGYVEASAALAQARKLGRIASEQHTLARTALDDVWLQLSVVELDAQLAASAADLAERLGLRGYDAVHAAAALCVSGDETVMVSGDRALAAACSRLGLMTSVPNASGVRINYG
jgi:predicted nucleic acid-binding protein